MSGSDLYDAEKVLLPANSWGLRKGSHEDRLALQGDLRKDCVFDLMNELSTFSADNLSLGVRFQAHLTVDLGLNELTEVPVVAFRGSDPGRRLVLVAGVHGNEYEGMEAARRVIQALDPATMSGSVVVILTANPLAYAQRSRTTPASIDGLNLARVFPGNPLGSPTERLASTLLDFIERHAGSDDLVLDLHSGSGEVAFRTLVGFRDIEGPAREPSETAARHMGMPDLWRIPDSVGPLNAETARRGIPTIGTETTGRAGCRPEDVQIFETGIWNLLGYLEIVKIENLPPPDTREPHDSVDVCTPVSGFSRTRVDLGSQVRKGAQLAEIVDIFGQPVAEVVSPADGEIWAALQSPKITEGDLMFMIAFLSG